MVHYLVAIIRVRKCVIAASVEIARGPAREHVHVGKLVIIPFLPSLPLSHFLYCLFVCLFVGRFVMAASAVIVRGLARGPVHVGKLVIVPSLSSP